jgi:hypothetical protein
VTLVNVSGPFDPADDRPAALLRQGPRGTVHVVPAEPDGAAGWRPAGRFAMGGAYVSGDSRLMAAAGFYGAVALHDYGMDAEGARP